MRPVLAVMAALSAACQSVSAASPAVLTDDDAQTIAALESALAAALGTAHVELGAGDLTKTSAVTALPRALNPREDRSLARPVAFDLFIEDDRCYAIRRDTQEKVALPGVSCRPAPDGSG